MVRKEDFFKKDVVAHQYIFGEYVLQGIPSAFNDECLYWLMKRNMKVSLYCFNAKTKKDVENYIKKIETYIFCFKKEYENHSDVVSCQDYIKNKFDKNCKIPSTLYKEEL